MRRRADRIHRLQMSRTGFLELPVWAAVITVLFVLCAAPAAGAKLLDVSGRYSLATVIMPVPVSLAGGMQLNTPGELSLLKFGIESELDCTITIWDAAMHVNSAINIAGLERVIVDGMVSLGPFDAKLEIWHAVPFETVTDASHFTNWVVIPPADLMYVKTRIHTSADFTAFSVDNLFMIEDVNFPNPYADFGPLVYEIQSQSFHVGDILTITCEPFPGVTLRSVTNIAADGGSRPVKGYSAPGRVCVDCSMCESPHWNQSFTLTGLEYCGIPFWFRLDVEPCGPDILRLAGGGSFSQLGGLELSGSFSLFPLMIGGYNFSFTWNECLSGSVSLSNAFRVLSANVECEIDIPFGAMTGTFTSAATFAQDLGATSIRLGASASQGLFSGSLNVGFSKQQGTLRLSTTSTSLSMTLTPLRISFSVVFSRVGLRQATLDVGVTF